jgi:oligopeptide/dipeptide ABC transporter ATP-binding protein
VTEPLLSIRDLQVEFETDAGAVTAVRQVGFDVQSGETVALVGESGCGKSVTALSIMGLISGRVAGGSIRFQGRELVGLPEAELRELRGGQVGMIFQEPMTSLNPVFRIGQQLEEALLLHRKLSQRTATEQAVELLGRVGISSPRERLRQYPHELSGGMKQRVMIAMAIACGPKLLIADEPTTALDVTIQAQIMALLKSLKQELHMAVLLITHDLGVVAHFADRVEVMYAGKIVERGPVRALFKEPAHPYTRALLGALPDPNSSARRLEAIPGRVPSPALLPPGCAFCARCRDNFEPCETEQPPLIQVWGRGPEPQRDAGANHESACWLHDPKRAPTRRYRRETR